MTPFTNLIEEVEKGCGEHVEDELMPNEYYICGKTKIIEPNREEYYYLCPSCQTKLQTLQKAEQILNETLEKIKEELKESFNSWDMEVINSVFSKYQTQEKK